MDWEVDISEDRTVVAVRSGNYRLVVHSSHGHEAEEGMAEILSVILGCEIMRRLMHVFGVPL